MQLFVVRAPSQRVLQGRSNLLVGGKRAVGCRIALPSWGQPSGPAVVVRTENYHQLDLGQLGLHASPELGVRRVAAAVIDVRAHHPDQVSVGTIPRLVAVHFRAPCVNLRFNCGRRSWINRTRVGQWAILRGPELVQGPAPHWLIGAVFYHQRLVELSDDVLEVVNRER